MSLAPRPVTTHYPRTKMKDKMAFMDTKHNTDTDININWPGVITVDKVNMLFIQISEVNTKT